MYKRRESAHTPVDGYDPVAPTVTTRACHLLFVPQTYILRAPGMQCVCVQNIQYMCFIALYSTLLFVIVTRGANITMRFGVAMPLAWHSLPYTSL